MQCLKEEGIKASSSHGLFGVEPVLGLCLGVQWAMVFPGAVCPVLLRGCCKMGAIQALSHGVFLTGISSFCFFFLANVLNLIMNV